MDAVNLINNLNSFIGTEAYHRWSMLYPKFVLTDGAKYLADEARAYWLMDLIGSYQPRLLKWQEYFQVWKIQVNQQSGREVIEDEHSIRTKRVRAGTAVVTCEDGNGRVLVKQGIEYTDFPLAEFTLYAIWDGSALVILLTSEY